MCSGGSALQEGLVYVSPHLQRGLKNCAVLVSYVQARWNGDEHKRFSETKNEIEPDFGWWTGLNEMRIQQLEMLYAREKGPCEGWQRKLF